ncbi:MAG TPA: sigma-70 family RNA polymerase sigma factor [Thermomicrobiales bacterium]|nr:sigma-70 family RNA polymerase sigma factor [Thermomicrobiales bacterium]
MSTAPQSLTAMTTEQDRAYPDLEDAALVALMAAQDSRALETLYERHARIVFSFALRIVGDPASAEEIVQEAFFRSWQQATRFTEGRGTYVTWLLSITHNLAIDEIRKRQRRPQRADSADPVLLLTNLNDPGLSVEDRAMQGSWRDEIETALKAIPDAQREPIELAYFSGLTQREIADQLGEPLGTIKTRMRLGMRKLRETLEQREVGLT